MQDIVSTVLQSYGFQTQLSASDIIETEWRTRSPRAAERSVDGTEVSRVRERVRVRISRRARGLVNARMTAQYEAMTGGQWSRVAVSEPTVEQYKEIQQKIENRLKNYMTQS